MKFTVKMKTAKGLFDSIWQAIVSEIEPTKTEQERVLIIDHRDDIAYDVCRKWFRGGEYLTVEIDTEEETITVLPVEGK
jgi:hypothetical protein